MHNVYITEKGDVFTFGCNDEGALGRKTEEEEECMITKKYVIYIFSIYFLSFFAFLQFDFFA